MGKVADVGLLAVFWLIVVPAGALLRLAGVDLMGLRRSPRAKTYWIKRRQAFPIRMDRQS